MADVLKDTAAVEDTITSSPKVNGINGATCGDKTDESSAAAAATTTTIDTKTSAENAPASTSVDDDDQETEASGSVAESAVDVNVPESVAESDSVVDAVNTIVELSENASSDDVEADEAVADGKDPEEQSQNEPSPCAEDKEEEDEENEEAIAADATESESTTVNNGDEIDSHTPTLEVIAEDSQENVVEASDVIEENPDDAPPASPSLGADADSTETPAIVEASDKSEAKRMDDADAAVSNAPDSSSTLVGTEDDASLELSAAAEKAQESSNEMDEDIHEENNGVADDGGDDGDGDNDDDDDDNDDDDDDEGAMAIDEDALNGADNSLDNNDVQHVPIIEEVHAISDSDDEDDDDHHDHQRPSAKDDSASNSRSMHDADVENMDVDGPVKENGHTTDGHHDVDSDKPVSIASDSDADNDDESPAARPSTQNNGVQKTSPTTASNATTTTSTNSIVVAAGNAPAATNHSDDDEDDCMVIEDDDDDVNNDTNTNKANASSAAPVSLLLSPRRSGRSRKSAVQVRDFSKFDDDIEEIADDPLSAQPAAKKPKSSLGTGASASSAMSITIQDARSLAIDPLHSSASHNTTSFQQQQQHQFGQHTKKEPTLVIIDTNQLMGRTSAATAASVQALQSQNISVHPVTVGGTSNAHIYPTNLRASITPVSMATITKTPMSGNVQHNQQHHHHHLNNNSTTTITKSTGAAPGGSGHSAAVASTASLLPALTDDMFVLEAPSFIVPYIYEKPPGDQLRDICDRIGKELAEQKKQEDIEVAENEAKEMEAMSEEQRKLAELARAADANKKKQASTSKQKRGKQKSGDESWDESDTSTDDEASDTDQPARTKVLIQEVDTDPLNAASVGANVGVGMSSDPLGLKRDNYFESPLGRFFMDIGVNLVQEHVQTDLLRQQKKKLHREGDAAAPSVQMAINSLTKNLEHSKSKNDIFKFETKRCEYCNFKSESALAMAHHYEAPHLNGQMFRCNFCPFEVRPPYDILFHMEAMHNVKARLDKAQTYHQCPNCPFEDNGKSKLARHAAVCLKKFRPEVNLNPPVDWEPPAKIPRIKPRHGLVGTATAYQAMAAQAQRSATNAAAAAALTLQQRQNMANAALIRGRGRPQQTMPMKTTGGVVVGGGVGGVMRNNMPHQQMQQQQQPQHQHQQQQQQHQHQQQHVPLSRQQLANLSVPNNYHLNAAGQFVQTPSPKSSKTSQQPSISITPLPRQQTTASLSAVALQMAAAQSKVAAASGLGCGTNANMKPGQAVSPGQKSFVICEICDGYIKDLDQLRNHMQWMHKVKIHPKMIYNRPPLNCQKCQFRFFTDQGLERHLLGSHGLVTSSMQEAANKGKDAGRCPVCGRMYQWKLLNHVSRDHNMTLKPAHLSYKCTVCTATFGMYKQFENHVYSAHSTVAKKAMDGKTKNAAAAAAGSSSSSLAGGAGSSKAASSSGGDSLLKPLKINDEITIIPQPATSRQSRGGGGGGASSSNMDSHVIEIL